MGLQESTLQLVCVEELGAALRWSIDPVAGEVRAIIEPIKGWDLEWYLATEEEAAKWIAERLREMASSLLLAANRLAPQACAADGVPVVEINPQDQVRYVLACDYSLSPEQYDLLKQQLDRAGDSHQSLILQGGLKLAAVIVERNSCTTEVADIEQP